MTCAMFTYCKYKSHNANEMTRIHICKWLCVTSWYYGIKPSYCHNPGTEPLLPLNTSQLIERAAERWGDKEALVSVHQGHRLTFQQVKEQCDKLAAGLIRLGLKPGDRLGIWGTNSSQWYLTFMAAARAGLILVNINPAYQTSELHYCLTKVGVQALIADEVFKTQKYHEMITNIAPEMKTCKPGQLWNRELSYLKSVIIISENKLHGAFRFKDIINSATPELISEVQQLQDRIQTDEGSNLQFTSGTTGQPKAALLTHHGTINNMMQFGKRLQLSSKEHRICLQVPLFHCFGNVLGLIASLCYGTTIVIPGPTFNTADSLRAIDEERCTIIYGTPTMYVDLISKAKESNRKFNSLELAVIAGAPFSKELIQELQQILHIRKAYGGYGMTETSPLSFFTLPTDTNEKAASTAGYIMEHIEVKVVDENGEMVPIGKPGELHVRGYGTMLKYWGEDTETKETIGPDRWLKTGDQFVLHEDGYGLIVGRIKDMIIRGGENIFPKEIEHLLEEHPDILEVQVIGIPDPRMGEEVCACIRLNEGASITPEKIKEYCKGKISHFKIPRYIHFMTEFPKTETGKIQKFKLRNMLTQDETAVLSSNKIYS